jgi:hypothetical protein
MTSHIRTEFKRLDVFRIETQFIMAHHETDGHESQHEINAIIINNRK